MGLTGFSSTPPTKYPNGNLFFTCNIPYPLVFFTFLQTNIAETSEFFFAMSIKRNIGCLCLEMIDIGGPTLLRSSSKNHESVTTICDIKDYKSFIKELNTNLGSTTLPFREKMAQKAYTITANYDSVISNWLNKDKAHSFKINNHKKINLRYGENPNQKSSQKEQLSVCYQQVL